MNSMNRRAKSSVRPRLVITVIYKKTGKKGWRAFCAPYDVTCNASSRQDAEKQITELVKLYEEGLENYNYPKHLAIKPLSYSEDKKVFKLVLKRVAEEMQKSMTSSFQSFNLERQRKLQVPAGASRSAVASYYSPQLVTA